MNLPRPHHPAFDGAHSVVDARGTLCPEPLRLTRLALEGLSPGATVHVLATDAHAAIDLQVLARRSGHDFLLEDEAGGVFHFLIRKGEN